ncbi:MAG TPA: glycosyltransferase family A protein [Bacteroidales bacterium]|nr:glycosyltransferase family A protein [Bacteroidales bacterium]
MAESTMMHIAIPAMNEMEFLPETLNCLFNQTFRNFKIWVCVNQPDSWWMDPAKKETCLNNSKTLDYLNNLQSANRGLHILDYSSPGKGWTGKSFGVGQARKTILDTISAHAKPGDILVSLDADTLVPNDYLESVGEVFKRFPAAVACSNPYFHKLTGDQALDRAMLRYEIYMRHYAVNMWRIGSPYSFTALGSAISLPVWAYRKVGGITAKKSGEDFYFLQKLRKTGYIVNYNPVQVFPATRYSDRVFFGTGPALIKGSQGKWESYPIYDFRLFDSVLETYRLFPLLFDSSLETPMSNFLNNQFGETDIFAPLRKNHKNPEPFVKACHDKIDGLRILQYLKHHQANSDKSDDEHLTAFLRKFYPEFLAKFDDSHTENLCFKSSEVGVLDNIRNFLREIESAYQKENCQWLSQYATN